MLRSLLALMLVFALPASVIADNHHDRGGGHGSSRSSGGSSGSRPAPPPQGHYAPPAQHGYGAPRQQPPHPYSPPRWSPPQQQHGSVAPQQRGSYTVPQQHRYTAPQQHNYVQQRSGNVPQQRSGYTGRGYATQQGRVSGNRYRSAPYGARRFSGPVIANPRHWGGWGWNRGVAWYPRSTYWGGGFWGPWDWGSLAAAVLFGSIIDYQDQAIYPSYEVAAESPGAELLQNYELQQTECGPPNLVVIWGPDNSVICAYPNNLVAPGNYDLDPETLTITSSAPQ